MAGSKTIHYTPSLMELISHSTITALEEHGFHYFGRVTYDGFSNKTFPDDIPFCHFKSPEQSTISDTRTLYRLYERYVDVENEGVVHNLRRVYAVFAPSCYKGDDPNYWSLNRTLKCITEDGHFDHLINGRETSIHPNILLIPYFNPSDNTWLLLSIRPDYGADSNLTQLAVLNSAQSAHPLTHKLIGCLKQYFSNYDYRACFSAPLKQERNLWKNSGAWVIENIAWAMQHHLNTHKEKLHVPTAQDVLHVNEQMSHYFEQTGQGALANVYLLTPPSFWLRHRQKIALISVIIASSLVVAGFVFMAPQMTAGALVATGATVGIDITFLTSLSLAQFAIYAAGAMAMLSSLTICIGLLISKSIQLLQHSAKSGKKPSSTDPVELHTNAENVAEEDPLVEPEDGTAPQTSPSAQNSRTQIHASKAEIAFLKRNKGWDRLDDAVKQEYLKHSN